MDELPIRPSENSEVLNVVVTAVLSLDGVEHDCLCDAVRIQIASDNFAHVGIFFAMCARGLIGDEFIDGSFVSILGRSKRRRRETRRAAKTNAVILIIIEARQRGSAA